MGTVAAPRRTFSVDVLRPELDVDFGGSHDVVASTPFLDVLACRCGVLATADHERRAWTGDDHHVLPFGPFERSPRFSLAPMDEPPVETPEPAPFQRVPPSRRQLAVMAALGIEPPPDTVDDPNEPNAD